MTEVLKRYKVQTPSGTTVMKLNEEDAELLGGVPVDKPRPAVQPEPPATKRRTPSNKSRTAANKDGAGGND